MGPDGFKPPSLRLKVGCSTVELRSHEAECMFVFCFAVSLHSFLCEWWGWQDSNRAKRCCYAALSETPGLQSGGDADFPVNPLNSPRNLHKKTARSFLGRCNAQNELDRPRSHHPDRRNRHRGSRKAHSRTHCLGTARATFVLSLFCVRFLTTCFAQLVCAKRSSPGYVLKRASQGLVTNKRHQPAFSSSGCHQSTCAHLAPVDNPPT